jgi:hypothetical protein
MDHHFSPELLQRAWMHSHEEDTDKNEVYRPSTFAFPPARGRTGFELKSDETLIETGIGATDRRTHGTGKWNLDLAGNLRFYGHSDAKPESTRKIVKLERDRLVVEKSSAT